MLKTAILFKTINPLLFLCYQNCNNQREASRPFQFLFSHGFLAYLGTGFKSPILPFSGQLLFAEFLHCGKRVRAQLQGMDGVSEVITCATQSDESRT
jgi:hypothetical protein